MSKLGTRTDSMVKKKISYLYPSSHSGRFNFAELKMAIFELFWKGCVWEVFCLSHPLSWLWASFLRVLKVVGQNSSQHEILYNKPETTLPELRTPISGLGPNNFFYARCTQNVTLTSLGNISKMWRPICFCLWNNGKFVFFFIKILVFLVFWPQEAVAWYLTPFNNPYQPLGILLISSWPDRVTLGPRTTTEMP